MTDIFKDFKWNGYTEPRRGISSKRIVRSLVASEENKSKFDHINANTNMLVHKSSRALWKFSDDHKTIEPVYTEDVLTEDEV